METKEKESVALLNDLIIINNDRIEGYERAAKETEDSELKNLFVTLANESRKLKSELVTEVTGAGETVEEGTKTTGKIYRAWMDVKAALTGKDRKAILSSCEYGEDAALEEYDDVLKSEELSGELRSLVTKQRSTLKQSHDKVKSLRDSATSKTV